MTYYYLLFFLSFSLFAQSKAQIEVLKNPQSLEDFEHQFKGCPENSECDQVMGLQLGRWKDLVSKLKDGEMTATKKVQFLELFRAKYGIPVEFYTYQKSQLGFKPLLYNSSCRNHNPKDKEKKILRGSAFLKSLSSTEGVVWRDQTQIQVPVGELIVPQPVQVFSPTPVTYQLPLGDQPLFIKNKELHILREEDGLFYFLKISSTGDWKVEDVDMSRLSFWEDKRENVTCPVEKEKSKSIYFESSFCKKIWDEDTKTTLIIKMNEGCII
jgi:hypothetical protein